MKLSKLIGTLLVGFAFSLIEIPWLPAQAQDGTLDLTFGSGGKVITPIRSGYDSGYGVAIQPDGKIILAGESQNGTSPFDNDIALVRYNPNGSLDNSFGNGGIVITPIGPGWDLGGSVALQSDGKIVVAGQALLGSTYDFVVVRYNPNGTLDNSFGAGGIAETPVGASHDYGWFCAIQPTDQKIVLVGPVNNGSNLDFGVVRYNSNGSLDNSFGSGGKVITPVYTTDDYGWSCCFQPDGKILVGGSSSVNSNSDFALVRYHSNGELDNSFGAQGKVTTPIGPDSDRGRSVAIQTDGKIVLGGTSRIGATDDFALARYNTNGSLDNSFGSNGIVTTPVGTGEDILWAVAIQGDGKILAAGYGISAVSGYDFAVVRYNPNGSLDASFGVNGIALTPVGASSDFGIALALQSDAKIVVGGASVTSSYDFAIVRYENTPPTGISSPVELIEGFALFDCYPNPFNPATRIRFRIPRSEYVTLIVCDLSGRKVATLVQENLARGSYERTFDAGELGSGVYLYRLQAGTFQQTRKAVLIK